VNRLTRQSGEAVIQAAGAMHDSQLLATEIALMERSARQYDVVRDENLRDGYLNHRRQFLQYARALSEKVVGELQRSQLDGLIAEESALFRKLDEALPGSREAREAIDGFWLLNNMGRTILTESQGFTGEEVRRIQDAAAGTNRQLIIQAAVSILAAVILALLYSRLINRPIRQIEAAIDKLGKGNRTEPISVSGPRDLHQVGQQLDGLRQQLRALEQQKTTMLRNISHELKTPLATIREGIELLRDGVPGALNREQSDIVEIVRNDSLKLQKLIENVISLNVAQGEELSVTWQPVELRGLLDNVLEEHRLLMEGRGVRVDRTLDQARVSGDRDKLKTVFENVISNAVKYSPDGGEIAVGLRRNAGHAHVDVIDHGPGVDPAERQKVFELFYRGRARAASQVKGSGVGLAIAQAYVQLHNGTIEFVDCPRGAHVRVVLPLAGE
jgi:two-component system sensor histidine kinase GlrK